MSFEEEFFDDDLALKNLLHRGISVSLIDFKIVMKIAGLDFK